MFFKKLILIVCVCILFFQFGFSVCYFELENPSACERFSDPFNSFVVVTPLKINEESTFLYSKDLGEGFTLQTNINGNTIRNAEPFTRSGVYVLKLGVEDSFGNVRDDYEFEFIFDNSEPLPPVITNFKDGVVYGKTQLGNTPISEFSGGDVYRIIGRSNENRDFSFRHSDIEGAEDLVLFGANDSLGKFSNMFLYSFPLSTKEESSNITSISNFDVEEFSGEDLFYGRNLVLAYGRIEPNKRGIPIHINGQKTLTNNGGEFYFIHKLHKGENTIEVVAGDQIERQSVEYNNDLGFTKINLSKKIVSSRDSSFSIETETSNSQKHTLLINGEIFDEIEGARNTFEIPTSNLKKGRNTVTLQSLGEVVSRTIFLDTEIPNITIIENNPQNLVFSVTDDTGVLSGSVSVIIQGVEHRYTNNRNFRKIGNYYILNVRRFAQGTPFSISAEDRAEKSTIDTRSLTGGNSPFITNVDFGALTESFSIGNKWFVSTSASPTKRQISLHFSSPVTFDKIVLDEEDFTDYTIVGRNTNLNISFSKKNGTLKLLGAGRTFNKTIEYTTEDVEPTIDFFMPKLLDDNHILFSGVINNPPLVDFSKLKVSHATNPQPSVSDYGKYFETVIPKNLTSNSGYSFEFHFLNSLNIKNLGIPRMSFSYPELAGRVLSKISGGRISDSHNVEEFTNKFFFNTQRELHFLPNSFGTGRSYLSSQADGKQFASFQIRGTKKEDTPIYIIEKDTTPPFYRTFTLGGNYYVIGEDRQSGATISTPDDYSGSVLSCPPSINILSFEDCIGFSSKDSVDLHIKDRFNNSITFDISQEEFPQISSENLRRVRVYLKDVIEFSPSNFILLGQVSHGEIKSLSIGGSRNCVSYYTDFKCTFSTSENLVPYRAVIERRNGTQEELSGEFNILEKHVKTKIPAPEGFYSANLTTETNKAIGLPDPIILNDNLLYLEVGARDTSEVSVFFSGNEVLREEIEGNKNFTIDVANYISHDIDRKDFSVEVKFNNENYEEFVKEFVVEYRATLGSVHTSIIVR